VTSSTSESPKTRFRFPIWLGIVIAVAAILLFFPISVTASHAAVGDVGCGNAARFILSGNPPQVLGGSDIEYRQTAVDAVCETPLLVTVYALIAISVIAEVGLVRGFVVARPRLRSEN
jgi:hypothetical protein